MKIKVTNLTPNKEKVIVTHNIGDVSVKRYIEDENILDYVVECILDDMDEDGIRDVLEDGIFSYLGEPDNISEGKYHTWSREIMDLILDKAVEIAESLTLEARDWEEAKESARRGEF